MYDFKPFAKLVNDQINLMQKTGALYVVEAEKNEVWDLYLSKFPEGTDPLYKERSVHDCNCCKHFVRSMGNVVAFVDNKVVSIWDLAATNAEYPFDLVAKELSEKVLASKIVSVYMKDTAKFGVVSSNQLNEDYSVTTWNHFHAELDKKFVSENCVSIVADLDAKAGVLRRSLEELTMDASDTVIDLIKSNSIYRGTEFKSYVQEFVNLKREYSKLNSDEAKSVFIWKNIHSNVTRFKNTLIGGLVENVSKGFDLETAVRMYESQAAPENYKRSKSIITPNMVKSAMKTIGELGIEESLHRRYAVLGDVSVNNVLFVNNDTRSKMEDAPTLTSMLMDEAKSSKVDVKSAMQVHVDYFMDNVLPKTDSMEMLFRTGHANNLMSVTAPSNADAPNILGWDNNFAWSYNGNVTDSIKDKVKRAGGNVESRFRVSLNWFNTDDLDIHVKEPDGNKIYYGNPCGKLDVDMNISNPVRDAVENIHWRNKPMDGIYEVMVNNFTRRESIDVGFNLQVEIDGRILDYSYNKVVSGTVSSLLIHIKDGMLMKVVKQKGIEENSASQAMWGINSEKFVPVNTLILSPNHWDDNNFGNKHWFFILKDCLNPDDTRGIYNEYLAKGINEHRKVFEILGDKLKCPYSPDQMSGLGFSSTKKDTVVVKVTNAKMTTLYEITF